MEWCYLVDDEGHRRWKTHEIRIYLPRNITHVNCFNISAEASHAIVTRIYRCSQPPLAAHTIMGSCKCLRQSKIELNNFVQADSFSDGCRAFDREPVDGSINTSFPLIITSENFLS